MSKVLVVEDDDFLVKAYKLKLEKEGYEVVVAKNGDQALKEIKDNTPDVMILDVIMPGKDGFDVLEEMQKHDDWKKIPVIVSSNLGQKGDVDRGFALGAKKYVVKSDMSIDDMVGMIKDVL